MNVRGVRALAHPLRLALLDRLRFEGPATATQLAHRVGESSGATSYHLRLLAKYGYIEEAPRRKGRERWWAYRERKITLPGDREGRSDQELLAGLLSREAHALDSFLSQRSKASEWDDAAFFQSRAFRLTPGELRELQRGIESLLAPLRRADAADAPEDARPVRLLAFGFPLLMEDT
jgi:DNA-binding transcriptional ArsR family regulator